MSAFTTYTKAALAAAAAGTPMPAPPTTWYYASHAGDPTDDGSANEVTDIGRVAVTAATEITDAADSFANTNDLDFSAATIDVGDVTHYSIWDDPTAGNCWYSDELTDAAGDPLPVEILTGDVLRYPAGSIVVTFV